MFVEIIIALLLGICFGIITGLTPGIHINLVSVLLISFSPFLLQYFPVLALAVFIISMSVTHTFLDSIPSVFLGAPDADTALGVLPGHRYLLRGNGLMAVKLTVIGSFGAIILSIILFPILLPFVKFIYPYLSKVIGYLLVFVVVFMILRDRKKPWAVFVFFLSGIFGILVLSIPDFKNPLFPMLSGMFGISTLLISYFGNENIPKQKFSSEIKINKKNCVKALVGGEISGFITAVMPGLGGSSAAVISMQMFKDLGDNGFMILMGAINTVNFTLSLVTLSALNKARNGSVIAVQQLLGNISIWHIAVFLAAALIAGSVSVFLALKISRIFCKLVGVVDYKKLLISVILLICLLVVLLTGPIGFFILLISTAIGLIPAITKVTRTHSMGCLLLPVIVFFVL